MSNGISRRVDRNDFGAGSAKRTGYEDLGLPILVTRADASPVRDMVGPFWGTQMGTDLKWRHIADRPMIPCMFTVFGVVKRPMVIGYVDMSRWIHFKRKVGL